MPAELAEPGTWVVPCPDPSVHEENELPAVRVGGLTRDLVERETLFIWDELDDGQGQRWLQHDGAGNAWTPEPEVLDLLNLIDR